MEAEELRIGNWYAWRQWDKNLEKGVIKHYRVTRDVIWNMTKRGTANNSHRVMPIPLTEEVLLNSGFEKIESRQDYFELSSYDPYNPTPEGCRINVFFDFDGVRLWYAFESDGARLIRRIHYVHQLQNLYFALTGEELNIEL